MLASVLANCHRDAKKRRKPYEPADFLPDALRGDTKARKSPVADPAKLALFAAKAFGAPPEILAQIREAETRRAPKARMTNAECRMTKPKTSIPK